METHLVKLMAESPLFTSLSQKEGETIANLAISRNYQKGECIAHYGDVWPYLILVGSGMFSAVKESGEGRSLIVTTIGSGEIFWGPAFFHENAPIPVMLEAREPCLIYLWPREQLLPILLRNGSLSWELCRLMVSRMLRASEIVEELAFRQVAGRLARLLLDQFADVTDGRFTRNLTLDEMAGRIGSTREMVCRFLHRFAADGLINITRTEVSLEDPDALLDLAKRVK